MLAAVNVALLAGPGITVAASADPFSGEVFWTDGNRACARSDGADTALAPTPGTQLVDVNLDPPFPNAPGFRAVSLLADEAFTARFRPRVVSTTLALAWVAAGGSEVAAGLVEPGQRRPEYGAHHDPPASAAATATSASVPVFAITRAA